MRPLPDSAISTSSVATAADLSITGAQIVVGHQAAHAGEKAGTANAGLGTSVRSHTLSGSDAGRGLGEPCRPAA